mgnify:CR=1 FL=1
MITTTTASSYVKRPQISHTDIPQRQSLILHRADVQHVVPAHERVAVLVLQLAVDVFLFVFFCFSDERGVGNGTHTLKKRRKQRQNNTRRLSFCATSIEPVTREDMKRVVVESSVGEKARKRARIARGKKKAH